MTDITIYNQNNELQMAEGLSYFKIKENGANYLFYTLNETPDPERIKIYAMNVASEGSLPNQIDDTTWKTLVDAMKNILKGENLDKYEFLNWENVKFQKGSQIPHPIAIKKEQKQEFITKQLNNVSTKSVNDNTPVVEGSSTFFNSEVVGQTNTEQVSGNQNQVNIFDNPMKPEFSTEKETIAPVQEVVPVQETKTEETQIQGPAPEVQIEVQPVQNTQEINEVNKGSESMISMTQEQFDIIKKALASINEVMNNVKVIDQEEKNVNVQVEETALPIENVQATVEPEVNSNVLAEESTLTNNEVTNDQVVPMNVENTEIIHNAETPVQEVVPAQPEAAPVNPAPAVQTETPVLTEQVNQQLSNEVQPTLAPVGVAPVLPENKDVPAVEIPTQPVQDINAQVSVEPAPIMATPVVNQTPVAEAAQVVQTEVQPVQEITQQVSAAPDPTNTPAQEESTDLNVFLPDMPSLNELENTKIQDQTGEVENENNQAVQIGSRPAKQEEVTQDNGIPAIEPASAAIDVNIGQEEQGESALETAMDNVPDNTPQQTGEYVATSGTNVSVTSTPVAVQENIPVVMPTGSSVSVQQAPQTEPTEVYGPGTLTPGAVSIANSRPAEVQQPTGPSLSLTA